MSPEINWQNVATAHAEKIKELESKLELNETHATQYKLQIMVLESYKADWQSIAGKANLKHLMKRLEEAEEVIKAAQVIHSEYEADIVMDKARDYLKKYEGDCDE